MLIEECASISAADCTFASRSLHDRTAYKSTKALRVQVCVMTRMISVLQELGVGRIKKVL